MKDNKIIVILAIICSCVGFCFLALKTDLIPYEIVQNAHSQKIVARKTLFGFPISQMEIMAGNGGADSEIWNKGVVAVFDTPLYIGERIWVRKGGSEAVIRLNSLQLEMPGAEFLIESEGSRRVEFLKSREKIHVSPDVSVGWSPKSSQSVYIFADDFPLKDRSLMYSVKFSEDGPYLTVPTD